MSNTTSGIGGSDAQTLQQLILLQQVARNLKFDPNNILLEPNKGNVAEQYGLKPVIVVPPRYTELPNGGGNLINKDLPQVQLVRQPDEDTFVK